MKNLRYKVLDTIKTEKIKPKPKWQFLLKNYLLWFVFGLNVLFGSIFFTVVLLYFSDSELDLHTYLSQNFLDYVVVVVPVFRLALLGMFIFLVYYNYKHIGRGYKYKTIQLVLMSVVIVMIIGGTLFVVGLGYRVDDLLAKHVPYYENIDEHRQKVWTNPENGLLSGEIIEIYGDNSITIRDFKDNKWSIDISSAKFRGYTRNLEVGQKIKIIGNIKASFKFIAKEIRPWFGGNARNRRLIKDK